MPKLLLIGPLTNPITDMTPRKRSIVGSKYFSSQNGFQVRFLTHISREVSFA